MTSQLLTALQTLAGALEKDELAIVAPLADNYFTAIQANPAPANVVAQSVQLETSVITALPNMEAAGAKDAAAALKTLMDTELASLATANTSGAATGAAST